MKIKHGAPLALAAALGFAGPAIAADREDETFLKEAISGHIAEVRLGQLAEEKGQSEAVRAYGRQLVMDHEQAMEKAKQVADAENVDPPTEPPPEAQEAYDRLARLSIEEFDEAFVQQMIVDHEKHIQKFQQEAARGDSSAAQHAEQTLPALEEHLEVAESIESGPRG